MTASFTPHVQHEFFELIHCPYPSYIIDICSYLIAHSILFNRNGQSTSLLLWNSRKINHLHTMAHKLLLKIVGLPWCMRPEGQRKGVCFHESIILRTAELL